MAPTIRETPEVAAVVADDPLATQVTTFQRVSESSEDASTQAGRLQHSVSKDSIMQDVRKEVGASLQAALGSGMLPLPQRQCSVVRERSNSVWDMLNGAARSMSRRMICARQESSQCESESLTPNSRKDQKASKTPKTPGCSYLETMPPREEPAQTKSWSIPFRVAIICPTLAMIFVSSVAFVALASLSHQAQQGTLKEWTSSNRVTLDKWRSAVVNAQSFAVKKVLHNVDREVYKSFVMPPNEAIDTLVGAIRAKHNAVKWNFTKDFELRHIEVRAWEALGNQWRCQFAQSKACPSRADSLYASFKTGGFAGAAFASLNGALEARLLFQQPGQPLEIWRAHPAAGSRLQPRVLRTGYQSSAQPFYNLTVQKTWSEMYLLRPWVETGDSSVIQSPNWYRREAGVGGWGGICTCPNGERYQVGDNQDACASLACDGGSWGTCTNTGINSANAGMKVTCDHSPVVRNASGSSASYLAMTRTSPIMLNGQMSGVVGADVSFKVVSDTLLDQWGALSRNLALNWNFRITSSTSSVFIVNQASANAPWQEGLLLGTSNQNWFVESGSNWTKANESLLPNVADASRAILLRYGSWRAAGLAPAGNTVFYFSVSHLRDGILHECQPLQSSTSGMLNCMQVATHSIRLDAELQWLIVAVLPSQAYFQTYNEQVMQTTAGIDVAQQEANSSTTTINTVCILVMVLCIIFALLVALITSILVLRPLSRLGVLMDRLGQLEFDRGSPEYFKLQSRAPGRVREFNVLRERFCRLSQSIETFAKFVPEAVVRRLVSADEQTRQRATQLNVSKREVTIMFSDVRDFTSISEALTQKQLLFVLTLYLTVMTRIIEQFDGVVGEVLGDGLLCFWNTPDPVENHAAKACTAAMAQQQALGPLNAELAKRNLPELKIRIGLHTGEVLTGNIGSEHKMKFGCMGDPVNLASRLEGLCKVYGVGIMCSEATREALPDDYGFVTRRLDLVQVKGKKEPTLIYELIGRDCALQEWGIEPVSPAHVLRAQSYEEALEAYQKAKFNDAVQLAEALQKQDPEDLAAGKLLERAKGYQTNSNGGFWDFLNMGNRPPITAEELAAWTGVEKMTDK